MGVRKSKHIEHGWIWLADEVEGVCVCVYGERWVVGLNDMAY